MMMSNNSKISETDSFSPLKIAALTDHLNTPSSRFRIRQHVEKLGKHGIGITDFPRLYSTQSAGRIFPDKRIRSSAAKFLTAGAFEFLNLQNTFFRTLSSQSYDSVWISRELIVGYPSFEKLLRTPIFYDIDDAIFLNKKSVSGVRKLIENAAAVFAGNKYLADYCSKYSSKVFNIPTAVDTDRFVSAKRKSDRRDFVVGWSGTSGSYKFFLPLEDELVKFFKLHTNARLKICSDRFPHELSKLVNYIDFEVWSPEVEVDKIQSFDVGIMPLDNSDWTKGKCSYKMLLYASCEVPTITSPYGMNSNVLALGRLGLGCESPAEWRDALEYVYKAREYLASDFPDCRQVVLENFSLDVISGCIAKIMRTSLE